MGNPCDNWSCVGYCFLPTDFLLMSDSMSPPCLVIDRGSSWTKLGFGGNFQPSFFLEKSPAEEDDFGHWFFSHLRVDPEQHACVLSEPSSSNPSARAECAETLFETYNVPALVLAPAPVLALYGTSQQQVGNVLSREKLIGRFKLMADIDVCACCPLLTFLCHKPQLTASLLP